MKQLWSMVILTASLIAGGVVLYPLTSQAATPEYTNADAQEILKSAGAVGVTVVWTSEHNVNCGAAESTEGIGGCYREESKNLIYISPELAGDDLEYVLLHEYAHVLQYRRGQALSECAADKMAVEWGADSRLTSYDCN